MARVIPDHEAPVAVDALADDHRRLGLSDDDVVALYRTMVTARAIDQKLWNLTRTRTIPFMIPGQGQEAAQVGSASAVMRGHDLVLPYYRDIGVVLTMGMTPYEVMLNGFARPEDPNSGGRQMPYHWGSKRLGIITGSSPIGTQLPHAAGLAKSSQIRDDDRVTICYFGEATASKGDFHEALNFAGIHRLPVVFVCENNLYAISVPMGVQSAVDDVATHARSYGFDGVVVDGNDALAVYGATKAAVQLAREGGGPTLVECKTYRLLPHTSDDDDKAYRSPEEVATWRGRDPIPRMRRYLLDGGILSDDDDARLHDEVGVEVDEATRRAEAAAPATAELAFTKVYARPLRPVAGAPASASDGISFPSRVSPVPDGGVERNVLETVRHTLHELMAGDDEVVVLGEDVGLLGGVFRATEGLQRRFGPNRVIDTPLAESSIAGIAIGMALDGLRPVAEIQFADFLHSCFDQLVSEAAKIHYRSNGDFNVPLVVRAPWGGGTHRAIYHSQAVEAFYAHVAGLKVVVPSTPADVAGLLRSAVEDPDPVLFLEHKKTYRRIRALVPEGDWRVPIGVADIARPGDDLTVVTYGVHRHHCLAAAEELAGEGFSVEVVDLRTISPLDRDTVLASVARTGRLLVVHEDNVSFGVGAEVAAIVAEEAFYDLDAPVRRLAMADVPAAPYAMPAEAAVMIGPPVIADACRSLLKA
ncbi:MAG TPA: dehydrogenase E1 component subunit alpha/beta [Acidimicrobiales bacterium]|jgi:2-oxoisovalerate dehydrogenase E1 component|nr:dehydrogenase E1 component subunit alpha/beta [Acidimicrobiales bacterium]